MSDSMNIELVDIDSIALPSSDDNSVFIQLLTEINQNPTNKQIVKLPQFESCCVDLGINNKDNNELFFFINTYDKEDETKVNFIFVVNDNQNLKNYEDDTNEYTETISYWTKVFNNSTYTRIFFELLFVLNDDSFAEEGGHLTFNITSNYMKTFLMLCCKLLRDIDNTLESQLFE